MLEGCLDSFETYVWYGITNWKTVNQFAFKYGYKSTKFTDVRHSLNVEELLDLIERSTRLGKANLATFSYRRLPQDAGQLASMHSSYRGL